MRERGALMRNIVGAGALLAVTAALLVILGPGLGPDLEGTALFGVGLGAVAALVPDRTPWTRLGGTIAGLVVAMIGYVIRAALLPDTAAGRSVAVLITVILCVVIAAATLGRLPLWTLLLGAAAFAGAYEATYAAAPPELTSTAPDTAATLLLTLGVGFLVASLVAPRGEQPPGTPTATSSTDTKVRETVQ